MTVDSMRKIDQNVGVVLCLLIMPFVWLIDLLRGRTAKPDISRTLFIELSEMGSSIIVDPAMRKLKMRAMPLCTLRSLLKTTKALFCSTPFHLKTFLK